MKRLRSITALVIILCLLFPATAYAETLYTPEDDTVFIDISELNEDEGIPSDNYTIADEDEPVLEVRHVKSPDLSTALSDVWDNGYYTADFMIPNTNKKVFLTGLTQNNISEIQQAIIASYSLGKDFSLTDLGFIDTEKTRDEDDDDEMCWAASASNVLMYTGWGARAGFSDSDSIFESLITSYENKGGHPYYAIGWFFNGIDNFYKTNSGAARVVDYPNSGGYLKEYDFDKLIDILDLNTMGADGMQKLCEYLRDGRGVSLSFDLFKDGESAGAHSTTLWGYVANLNYTPDDKRYYTDILLTDSDSDSLSGADRRTAKNVMSCFALRSYEYGSYDTYMIDFLNEQTGVIHDCVVLQSYSPSVAYETDPGATTNRATTGDLTFSNLYITDRSGVKEYVTKFPTGTTLYYSPVFHNLSSVPISVNFIVRVNVLDEDGDAIYTKDIKAGNQTFPSEYLFGFGFLSISGIPAGDYTLRLEICPSHAAQEAYYYNNVITAGFKVRDTYICGDYDNDKSITPIDATFIQRVDLGIPTGYDDPALERGDVDNSGEVNIIDAMFVQRYATELYVPVDVGKSKIYD